MNLLRALIVLSPLALAAAPNPDAGGGSWVLVWDDSLDGELADVDKQCRLDLAVIGGRVNGSFVGAVSGREREALFTGEREGPLLLLQQREPGYVCSYQLLLEGDRFVGTWADASGASGTAVLVREVADPKGQEEAPGGR